MLTVSGFGDASANGTYTEEKTFNGYSLYRKDSNYFIAYYDENGPVSFEGAYYIVREDEIEGSIRLDTPEYKVVGTDPTASGWVNLLDQRSGGTTVGTVS